MSMWVGNSLVTLGVIFLVIGSIGVLRFPDFYSRAHAASKPDTLGLMLTILGLVVIEGATLSSAKLLLIVIFVSIGNPTATHALGRAALRSGLKPWSRGKEEA